MASLVQQDANREDNVVAGPSTAGSTGGSNIDHTAWSRIAEHPVITAPKDVNDSEELVKATAAIVDPDNTSNPALGDPALEQGPASGAPGKSASTPNANENNAIIFKDINDSEELTLTAATAVTVIKADANHPALGEPTPEQGLASGTPGNEIVEIVFEELPRDIGMATAEKELHGVVSFPASLQVGSLEMDPNGWFQPHSGDKIKITFPISSPIQRDFMSAYTAAETAALSRQQRQINLPLSQPENALVGSPRSDFPEHIGDNSIKVIRWVNGGIGWDCWVFPDPSWKSRFQLMVDDTSGRAISTRMTLKMFDGMGIPDWENFVTHFARRKIICGLKLVNGNRTFLAKKDIGAQAYYALALRVLEHLEGFGNSPKFCALVSCYPHAAIELSKMKINDLFLPHDVATILRLIGARHAFGVVSEADSSAEAADASDIVYEWYRSKHGEPKNAHHTTTGEALVEEFNQVRQIILNFAREKGATKRTHGRILGIAEGMLVTGLFNYVTAQQHYGAKRNMKIAFTVKTLATLGLAGATPATAGAHIPIQIGVALGVAVAGLGADHLTDVVVNKIVKIYDWRDGVTKAQVVLNFNRRNIAASSNNPAAIDFMNDWYNGQQDTIAAVQSIKLHPG